jgi:branched-chain amino acid transport system permease protein
MKNPMQSLGMAILAAFLALLPLFLPSFYTGLLSLILIFAIFAMSLDILQGYTGLPSLGHAAFYGVGAYTAALLMKWHIGAHGDEDFLPAS